MKYLLIFLILIVSTVNLTFSGVEGYIDQGIYENDSIIKVTGYIYDSATSKGIIGSSLTYEELPYGNFIGITRCSDSSGYFEFFTFGNEAYRIEVKAENYQSLITDIFPFDDHTGGSLKKNFPMVKERTEGDVIQLENLIFALGKSEINSKSFPELDRLVISLQENPGMIIQLEGHTDFRGGKNKNIKLSEDRVAEVKRYMMRKGIENYRILTMAFGGSNPISKDASEEAASQNRRVEVRIIKR